MTTNGREEKERIARKLGWDSYEDAPHPVRNNIDGQVETDSIEDPYLMFRRERDE